MILNKDIPMKINKKVLYRKFGPGKSDNLEMITRENKICKILGEKEIGPEIYGTFSGGRIEEFLDDSAPLTTNELKVHSEKIVEKIAKFHQLDIEVGNKNCLIEMLEEFEAKG